MKKVFIASHCMEIGGAERALIGLLNSFNYSEYQVDLLLYRQQGELLAYIPKEVNLLPENDMNCLAIPMKQLVKEKKYKMLYGRLKAKVKAHSYVKKHNYKDNQVELTYSHLYTYPYVQEIHGKYDLAISFLTPHYYVAKKVDAAKKIAWIHTDYSTIEVDEAVEMNMWNAFDYIASISEQCSQAFLKKLPGLKEKLIRIDNIILSDFIIRQADEFPVKEFDGEVNLLSVGRYSYAKKF